MISTSNIKNVYVESGLRVEEKPVVDKDYGGSVMRMVFILFYFITDGSKGCLRRGEKGKFDRSRTGIQIYNRVSPYNIRKHLQHHSGW